MFQESPTLFWTVYGLMTGDGDRLLAPVNMSLLSLFAVHYINRALIYPFRLKSSNGTPLTIVVLAGLFCSVNGYMQAMQLTEIADYETEYLTSPQFVFGVAMFCCGMYINIQADGILLNLRHPGQTEYSIPLRGMFRYVSGANFLGEMVEWIGFAIASNSLPATAFAVYTICNIFPRALAHHKWYQSKFGIKYPKRRKAVIPFVW
ncbi:hypothetical protein SARC_10663 [Sphaeroforma arctica JP610]|uniref:3-oxo-5alpha-steroid 4-dehydrogenase (NADP(+)) n=1 Tax=Sphaeroforma arctica JP610 TaxID=667725 RepID=A0A0L0FK47_9EUKA|nr:hypothetical protein SARC_10663 [Sphaeroforma arctica JP610]KNC76856.1 hypothetical protein SARC_10663 [Sphaeroforma arctica JP610]|eukprot:XP_014150758.1 hypothetical protein SARC_10663 [Sphaeroforma arctica JP610]